MNNCGKNSKEKSKKNQFLRNKRSFILVSILCMGIGFAFLSTNLTITGNTSVSGNSWNIYFTNVQVAEDSVEATVVPTTSGTNTTSIDYTVTLDKPGDFYEFTVDAVNNGTIDAMIQNINMTSLDSDVAKYISYTATYEDGMELGISNLLKENSIVTYKVRVEFKKDISVSDLNEEGTTLNLTFGVNYVQSNISTEGSNFIKLVKSSALSDTNIDFRSISSATNGRGLYVKENTKVNAYPIYYYRGNVSNNNAKFAGFCWKIVRTTETGGTKLLYNGRPNNSGQCTNTTGDSTNIGFSKFNTSYNSLAYSGYMYGTAYQESSKSLSTSHIYGNTFDYSNGTYTLSDIQSGVDNTHHYTCFSSDTSCTSIKYVYYVKNSIAYYIELSNGKSVEDALVEMQTNTTNSTIKTVVDNWFNNTFKSYFTTNEVDYDDYLEDTVWCNDRSMNTINVTPDSWIGDSAVNNGWKPNGGSIDNYLMYSSYGRNVMGIPKLVCSSKNDSFTVQESNMGNGALTYPVGLLTTDEILLAGGALANNLDYYLFTNKNWWAMSPSAFNFNGVCHFGVGEDGTSSGFRNNNDYSGTIYDRPPGVRPSISLKPTVKIASSGDGTSAHPYEFVVE